MKTVAIFGVGLIGGSFALALRKGGFSGRILGVSSPATLKSALDLGVIDEAARAREAAQAADLIYLSQPILRILEILPEFNGWARPEALITDAGSTKSTIVARAASTISRCQFLGGHPMAGREQRGVEAAEAGLFEGRPYVLTPRSQSELETTGARELLEWIGRIGAFPVILAPEEHDRIVAFTSHLPQLASTGLAALLDGRAEPQSRVFGPALVDSTRLALSSFDVWGDILATNRVPIQEALQAYIAKLEEFRQSLHSPAMRGHFEQGAHFASQVRDPTQSRRQETMTAHCLRCGWSWRRRTRRKPEVCPNRTCCSRYWASLPRTPVLCVNCGQPITEHEFVEGGIAHCPSNGACSRDSADCGAAQSTFQRPARASKEGSEP